MVWSVNERFHDDDDDEDICFHIRASFVSAIDCKVPLEANTMYVLTISLYADAAPIQCGMRPEVAVQRAAPHGVLGSGSLHQRPLTLTSERYDLQTAHFAVAPGAHLLHAETMLNLRSRTLCATSDGAGVFVALSVRAELTAQDTAVRFVPLPGTWDALRSATRQGKTGQTILFRRDGATGTQESRTTTSASARSKIKGWNVDLTADTKSGILLGENLQVTLNAGEPPTAVPESATSTVQLLLESEKASNDTFSLHAIRAKQWMQYVVRFSIPMHPSLVGSGRSFAEQMKYARIVVCASVLYHVASAGETMTNNACLYMGSSFFGEEGNPSTAWERDVAVTVGAGLLPTAVTVRHVQLRITTQRIPALQFCPIGLYFAVVDSVSMPKAANPTSATHDEGTPLLLGASASIHAHVHETSAKNKKRSLAPWFTALLCVGLLATLVLVSSVFFCVASALRRRKTVVGYGFVNTLSPGW